MIDSNANPAVQDKAGSGVARIAMRSAVWVTVANYANQAIGFLSGLVLARLIAPEIFGYLSLASFWYGILNLRAKVGANYAAVQQKETTGVLLGTYYALDAIAVFGSLLLSLIACFTLWALGYPSQVLLLMIGLVFVDVISLTVSPLSLALDRVLQLSRPALVSTLGYIVAYAIAIALALSGRSLWSLLSVSLVATSVSVVGVYVICRRRYPQVFTLRYTFNKALAMRLIKVGATTGLAAAALGTIVAQFDNFLIGTFVGATTLGFYDRAYRTAQWPNLLITFIISRVAFLTFAKVKDDPPRLTHTIRLALWALLTFGTPISLALSFGASDIISLLYGSRWLPSSPFLSFLAISNLLWTICSFGFWFAAAMEHRRALIVLAGTQALVLVVVATPLTLIMGSTGTIIGVGLSMGTAAVMNCVYIFRQVPLSPRDIFVAPVLATALTALVLFGITRLDLWSGLWSPARIAIVVAGIYVTFYGCLFMLRSKEMVERMRYLWQVWQKPRQLEENQT